MRVAGENCYRISRNLIKQPILTIYSSIPIADNLRLNRLRFDKSQIRIKIVERSVARMFQESLNAGNKTSIPPWLLPLLRWQP